MSYRIKEHPVLDFSSSNRMVKFIFNGKEMEGIEGEPIIVALRANGVLRLKEGAKHHTPYGPFCMQGRCCSCAMTVNNKPNVMTCVTPLEEGTVIKYTGEEVDLEVFKRLPARKIDISPSGLSFEHPKCELAIIGAGPAGMEAAISAAQAGVKSIVLFDDKDYLGGQLTLQTHTFFGTKELGASIRGYEIANIMKKEIEESNIDIRLNSTVIGLYPHNMLGFRDEDKLNFIVAKKIICATGASEKFLPFEGNCLPGVMGAGGAQTFMNIYGVKPGKKVLIIGGGNIGVILAYQLVQAGVEVACIIEATSNMGAYGVHVKKAEALGIPIHTSHTIKKAHGKVEVEGATIVELDDHWNEIKGTEKYLNVDTICLAVGLNPLNELLWQAGCQFHYSPELGEVPLFDKFRQTSNRDIFVAGDCAVIGEASIARLEGRIAGLKAALDLGYSHPEFNSRIYNAFQLLDNIQSGMFGHRLGVGKGKLTNAAPKEPFVPQAFNQNIGPKDFQGKEKRIILKCPQDIPCNPCEAACHTEGIKIGDQINQPPDVYLDKCKGCGLCLPACPGRAISILQYNYSNNESALTIPFEFHPFPQIGNSVRVLDKNGKYLSDSKIITSKPPKSKTGCGTVTFTVPKKLAFQAEVLDVMVTSDINQVKKNTSYNDNYVCRCEEVKYSDVIDVIGKGYNSINDIKRLTRVGMGQCRGISCRSVVENILRREVKLTAAQTLEVKKNRPTIFRPPIKRITLGEAAKLKFSKEEIQLFEGIEHVRTIPQEIINTYVKDHHRPEGHESSKITIIGGGVGGIFTAWWLAKMGEADVTVIEKNFLTSGQTGACLGGIRTGFNTKNKVLRAKKGLEIFKNAKSLIGKDVGWFQGGYVYLAFNDQQDTLFQSSFPTWEESQVKFEYLTDKSQFNRFVPGLDSQRITSIVHFPEAGGANPFKAVYMFAEDAKKMGVKFLTDHEVVSINTSSNKVSSLTVLNKSSKKYHQIKCEHIVNAAGTSSVRVAKMVGIDLSNQIWIERHGAFITEKMPFWLDPLVVSYHPTLSGYWQQKRMEEGVTEGEIVACYSASQPIKGFNTNSYIYFLARMAKAILICQPGMADIGIIRNFAEHYVGRASGIPIIGETPVKGFWLNIAKKGHGFMCGPGDAYALAKSILEGKSHHTISECTIEDKSNLQETMK